MQQDKAQLLVVEDDDVVGGVLQAGLSHKGYGVSSAKSNTEACDLLENRAFALMVLDWDLSRGGAYKDGDRTGRCVLRKSRQRYPMMPVIAITGAQSTDFRENALQEGATSFLQKPFSIDVLVKHISKLVEHEKPRTGRRRTGSGPYTTDVGGSS